MTTTLATVELPALDGRDPLGFLAALGSLRILSEAAPAHLCFDPATGGALLTSPQASIEALATVLAGRFDAMAGDELSVGLPSALVPRKPPTWNEAKKRNLMSGPDPARLDRLEFSRTAAAQRSKPGADWVAALWTDLADDGEERCARTPFNAPAGQQTFRSMFEKVNEIVAEDPSRSFDEALRSWRRVSNFTGENLDARASREAAQQVEGTESYGVPGATFLALSALPFFRLSGTGRLAHGDKKRAMGAQRHTVAWYLVPTPAGRRHSVFAWPLWRQPCDLDSVSCLLDHPVMGRFASEHLEPSNQSAERLHALGVWSVVMAARHKTAAGKSAGLLTVEQIWRVP